MCIYITFSGLDKWYFVHIFSFSKDHKLKEKCEFLCVAVVFTTETQAGNTVQLDTVITACTEVKSNYEVAFYHDSSKKCKGMNHCVSIMFFDTTQVPPKSDT